MKRIAIVLALSLMPIVAVQPAESAVCTRKVVGYKNRPKGQAGQSRIPIYVRVCR